jgi:hypothetical protein
MVTVFPGTRPIVPGMDALDPATTPAAPGRRGIVPGAIEPVPGTGAVLEKIDVAPVDFAHEPAGKRGPAPPTPVRDVEAEPTHARCVDAHVEAALATRKERKA